MSLLAIVGLGNPGSRFRYTRHNIGFQVLDALAQQQGVSWRSVHSNLELAEINSNNQNVLLLKPQTFMNSSGLALSYLLKKGVKAEDILVVHDELELPFGQIKCRQGGSAKGHNGLKSIIATLGPDFWRMRIGIGRPEHAGDVPDYVLQNFTEGMVAVDEIVQRAVDQVNDLLLAPS